MSMIFRNGKRTSILLATALLGWMMGINAVQAEGKKPLKVYVLVGQSNMQGHAKIETFEHIGMDPTTAPWLEDMQNQDGSPKLSKEVWVSYLSTKGVKQGPLTAGFGADAGKIGPELTFGITMQKHLNEPILLIKTAWGGKSLHTDFRPPSAGVYVFHPEHLALLKKQGKDTAKVQAAQKKASGHYYRLTVDHVKEVLGNIQQVYPNYEPSQGYELAGMVWFQGWNDMVDQNSYPNRNQVGGYEEYTELLAHFIRDVRKELSAPKLPVVIGVMGVGGPTAQYGESQQRYKKLHQNFRDAMAATADLAEFKGNVTAVFTEKYWDQDLGAIVARDGKLRHEVKKQKLQGKEAQAMLVKLRKQEFNQGELAALEKGVSNYPFHYLGSAKIMAGIGRGFADAMAQLQSNSAK
ncbi:sialate O-acetylesterase [Rubritalea tangerina]|uniref:Sialate O-acetylesterase n=1 Tax=Rubritalea tangerina TaxID=430798 RepID=A0ABW4Z913_9BACT